MAEPSILGALRDPQFRSDTLRNLVEALNGAKRSLTVGSLGAAGDMGSTLANLVRAGAGTAYHEATGRPIPQALEYRDPARDFGTSAHLGGIAERQGWLPPQTGSIPETAGALLGPIAAMKAPDLAQSTLRGLVSALKSEPSRRMIEGYVDALGARPKATVYHGSPHQFDAFDSSKIGTGEGAQSYGHGLYLAEAVDTAKTYRDKLAGTSKFNVTGTTPNAKQFANSGILNGELWELKDAFLRNGGDIKKTASDLKQTAEWSSNKNGLLNIAGMVERGELVPNLPDPLGSLYKVDLPDPLIARMLDWDKPLSQQAPEVQKAFQSLGVNPKWQILNKDGDGIGSYPGATREEALNGWKKFMGRNTPAVDARPLQGERAELLYRDLSAKQNGDSVASDLLRQQGIPGIRYLDGGSRADGVGTSNFVVFPGEESALTILERNGKPVRR